MPELYGVIGYPLGHSLSPLLHNTSFQAYHREAVFMSWPVPPGQVETFVQAVRLLKIRGCAVTIPHKGILAPYLDWVSEQATRVGAINTLYWNEDSLCGDNTDITGFISPLRTFSLPLETPVLVLGAGGAARAVLAGLIQLGFLQSTICSPTFGHAQALAEAFGAEALPWENRGDVPAGLIINTTPLGMTGAFIQETPYPSGCWRGDGLAYDLIYTPCHTRFLQEAAQAGWKTLSGRDMFFGQAEAQSLLWTGQGLAPEARAAVLAALQER